MGALLVVSSGVGRCVGCLGLDRLGVVNLALLGEVHAGGSEAVRTLV